MSTDIKTTTEEVEIFKTEQSEIRTELKELTKKQIELKAVLRAPHTKCMAHEMYSAHLNACKITSLLSRLNALYGKPNSHAYKKKEE